MKSWKTTTAGALAALGAYLETVQDPAWLSGVGKLLVIVGTAAIGYFARDNNVTSAEAGAGSPPKALD